jgi:DNA-binding MarR family transcriptional regulator
MAASSSQTRDQTGASLVPQLAESLARVSRRLRREGMKELAPLSLTYAQARVLHMLAKSAPPLRIGELAVRFEVAARSATSMIDSLEGVGLVRRMPDPTDRRSVLVGLTAAGRTLMERVGSQKRTSAEVLFGRLTVAQQRELLALLTTLNETDEGRDGCTSVPAPVGEDGA